MFGVFYFSIFPECNFPNVDEELNGFCSLAISPDKSKFIDGEYEFSGNAPICFSITVENEKMQKFLDELEDEYKKLEFPKNDFKIDDLFDE